MSNGPGFDSDRHDRDERASAGGTADWQRSPLDAIERAKAAYKVGQQTLAIGWLCSAIEGIADELGLAPTPVELKVRERKRRCKAAHGAPAQDAT